MNSNKTVIITGSSRGIGAAIAEKFALKGYNIVLNCLKNKEKLRILEEKLKVSNKNILAVQADVSTYEGAAFLYEKTVNQFGPADIIINNAGIAAYGLFTDTDPEQWQQIISTNLLSAMNLCHLSVKDMVNKKSGTIINISSIWGITGASCEAVYSASKGGLNTFTKALAKELGPSGITVNAIACGVIDTEMNHHLSIEEKSALIEEIPLLRFGTPDEAAELALFLASDSAKYMTGQILTLDGGFI